MFSQDVLVLKDKINEAITYASKETDVSVFQTIAVLEWIKIDIMHEYNTTCKKCGGVQKCCRCNAKLS